MSIRTVWSPRNHPVKLSVRDDTSDLSIIYSTFAEHPGGPWEDEYGLAGFELSGWAIDIGAHAGFVSMALLADNPDLRVIALEPLDENLTLAVENAGVNGWGDRLWPLCGAIANGKTARIGWDFRGDEGEHSHTSGPSANFRRVNRYIGGLQELLDYSDTWADVTAYNLSRLIEMAGGEVDLVKWDCEGCEWFGLDDPAVAHVRVLTGEWHGDPAINGLHALLDATHEVTVVDHAAAGLFRAVRR